MSNVALTWAWKCHVGNAPAKAVLVYLADRAGEDGSAAYPKIDTIMRVTELKESTVRKALKLLQERGFIRRGDQRYARLGRNGRDRLPQYCQVVWDLNVLEDPSTFDWYEDTHRNETDPRSLAKTVDPKAREVPVNEETKGLAVENVGNKPISSPVPHTVLENPAPVDAPDLYEVQSQPCTTYSGSPVPHTVLPYKETTQQVNPPSELFPSAPTGHLPASGATAPKRDDETQGGSLFAKLAGVESGTFDRLLGILAEARSRMGLTTPAPGKADRASLSELLRRLDKAGEPDPTAVLAETIRFATSGTWWPKRIRTYRQLAAHWDELRDDMTLETRRDVGATPIGGTTTAEGPHVHTAGCEHTRHVINSNQAIAIDPLQRRRLKHAARVADELNKHADDDPDRAGYFATLALLDLLRDERAQAQAQEHEYQAERERRAQESRRKREDMLKANGGSMFIGHRKETE
ncbi:MAG: helix-turn-helix domain-containing protein [Bifidobacterium longum]